MKNSKSVRVALNMKGLSDAQLEVKAQNIIDKMKNNANFPGPPAEVAAMEAALALFRAALIAATSGARADTIRKNLAKEALANALRVLGSYVDAKSNNDLGVLISSGFDARKESTPVGELPKPGDFRVELVRPGSAKLSVEKISGAKMYLFYYAIATNTSELQWTLVTSTTRFVTIEGLELGKQYAFKAAGAGTNPAITYSDEITRYIA